MAKDTKERIFMAALDMFSKKGYEGIFLDAGYPDVKIMLADGRIPCAVAVMKKRLG